MLHTSVVAVLLSLELLGQTPGKPSDWITIQSKEGGFSFSMPSKPIEQSIQVPTQAGKIDAKLYVCKVEGGAFVAQEMTRLPVAVSDNLDAEFEAAKKAAAPNLPKLVSEKKIKAGSVTGFEMVNSGPATPDRRNRTIKTHIFMKGVVACSLIVVSDPDQPLPPESDKFLDSFRFGGEPAMMSKGEMPARPRAAARAAPPAKRKPLSKVDLVDKTPEDAYRTFMMAIAAADEKTLRAVTLPASDFDVLLTGEAPPFPGMKELKQMLQKRKLERLKVGDQVRLPGNKVHVTRASEVGPDRAVLMPEGEEIPTRLRRVDGHWKVDASPVIEGRKAADAARAR